MELNLTIDQGNSSAKIVLWDGQTAVEKLTVSKLTRETLEDVAERMRPSKALVCSVTGNGPMMARWLGERGIEAREVTAGMPLPITIGYSTPATLGEDRVAAAAGAWHLFPGEMSLVVDMGTAVTYDVVSERGEFIGGNIAPGVGMRLRALRSFTARLPEVGGYGETPVFGHDTVTAMRAGAIRGVVAEIGYYRSRLPEGARVVLTGGWAERVSQFLDFPVTVDSCLVTKGLLSILLYNEDKTH